MIYEKYSVNGNTFIIFKDNYIQKDYSELAKRLCDVNTGIGADGLIAVQNVDEIERILYNGIFKKFPLYSDINEKIRVG